MSLIKPNEGVITQVNVFTCKPENQQALIELLIESAHTAREVPGWISANIHRSLDGMRVVNYAQSASLEAAQAVIDQLKRTGFFERTKRLGEAHPGLYEVVFTLQK